MSEETANASKIRRTVTLNSEDMSVRIAEHTGTKTGGDYLEVRAEEYEIDGLPAGITDTCTLHGLAQKLSDHTAGKSDDKGYSVDQRFDLIGELFGQLVEGDWTKKSGGGGTKLNQKQIASKMEELGLTPEQYEPAKKMGLVQG